MDISQSALAWLYLYALLLGMGLGAFYDVFRITRVFLGVHYSRRTARRLQELRLPFLTPHKKHTESRALGIVVFLEDLFFCVFTGIALVLLFYAANNGKFRFPVLLCAGVGFLLYRGTIGRPVMLFSEVIAFLIETAIRYIVFFLLFPLRILGRWVRKRIRKTVDHTVRIRRRNMRRHYTAAENGRAGRDACGLIPTEIPKQMKLKRGKRIGKGNENAVQSHASDAGTSRRTGRGIHRDICK